MNLLDQSWGAGWSRIFVLQERRKWLAQGSHHLRKPNCGSIYLLAGTLMGRSVRSHPRPLGCLVLCRHAFQRLRKGVDCPDRSPALDVTASWASRAIVGEDTETSLWAEGSLVTIVTGDGERSFFILAVKKKKKERDVVPSVISYKMPHVHPSLDASPFLPFGLRISHSC